MHHGYKNTFYFRAVYTCLVKRMKYFKNDKRFITIQYQ